MKIQSLVCSAALALGLAPAAVCGGGDLPHSYLSDEGKPYTFMTDANDRIRTAPLLELGDPFLGNGHLAPGYRMPGGAVWQPRLWVYGTYRTSVHRYEVGNADAVGEWANRLDLFANLQLTGSERLFLGVRPLDGGGKFFGASQRAGDEGHFFNEFNDDISSLFYEGDLGEMFPNLDLDDSEPLDIGFSVGRQQIVFQDGLLINDRMDAVGITKNSLRTPALPWLISFRGTALFAWNGVHRDNNRKDDDANLFGLFTAADTPFSTIQADGVFVDSDAAGDLWVWGLGSTQRIMQRYNTTVRLLGSHAPRDTAQSNDGLLLFTELSITPHGTNDVAYINGFAGKDNFRSAARDDDAGGPMGRTGILFAARGIGTYPSPISNRVNEAMGIVAGYQMFFANNTRHVILEAGLRSEDAAPSDRETVGMALQYQHGFGRRYIFQVDTFVSATEDRQPTHGIRAELQIKF